MGVDDNQRLGKSQYPSLRDEIGKLRSEQSEKSDEVCRVLTRALQLKERILVAAEQGKKEAWIQLPDSWVVQDRPVPGRNGAFSSTTHRDVEEMNKWLFGEGKKQRGTDSTWSMTTWRYAKIRLYELLEEEGFKVRTAGVRKIGETYFHGRWLVLSFENIG